MEDTGTFTLKYGGKQSWFDYYEYFLEVNHVYMRNKDAFYKNEVERSLLPCRLIGDVIWKRMRIILKVPESWLVKLNGYGKKHNWTKQNIFWELPYWKTNII